ncbi:MAG: hypothetical protein WBR26_17370 [Candidatus Acidiferrum sp.]
MNCPICKGKEARRSRRQNIADYIFSLVGVYPWRCRMCEGRFYARAMTLSDSLHAHCPVCGNPELKRISAEHLTGAFAFLWRRLGIPAYRCEPCRYKYFSILPCRIIEHKMEEVSSAD